MMVLDVWADPAHWVVYVNAGRRESILLNDGGVFAAASLDHGF